MRSFSRKTLRKEANLKNKNKNISIKIVNLNLTKFSNDEMLKIMRHVLTIEIFSVLSLRDSLKKI